MRLALLVLAAALAPIAPFTAGAEGASLTPEVATIVESERSFSRASRDLGIREAFLTFFADDSISFAPGPGPAIERIRARPPPTRQVLLSWDPVFADVSRAGDMGYTTGPTRFEDLSPEPQPIAYGYYFSVWRKHAGGEWKVAIDVGVGIPGVESPTPALHAASAPGYASGKPGDVASARTAILKLEREVGVDTLHLAEETRLHRDGIFPVLGRAAVLADLAQRAGPTHCEPVDAVVASSADLAFSYGSFTRSGKAKDDERGYYTHVWKRAPGGEWEIVAQIEQAPE